METKKWYKQDQFWTVIFLIGFMWVQLFVRNISVDGKFEGAWIGMLIGGFIRNIGKNPKEKEIIIFACIMIANYFLFRVGIYIPNYIIIVTGLLWMTIHVFDKENVTYKRQKKIIAIILVIGFFSLDHYIYENNIIKDLNFRRHVKKEYGIKDKIKENDVKEIEKLSLHNNELINRIDGVEYFENLKYLYIGDGDMIYDFEPIGKLNKLEDLTIWYTNVDKLEEIRKMEALQWLEITYPKGGKINNLDNFPNLRRFDVQGMNFYDLTGLEGPTNLERLDIGDGQVTSFDGIERFPELKVLDLYELQITDISKVFELKHLEKISIHGGYIPNMDEFEKKAKRRGIEVQKTKSTDLSMYIN